MTPADTNAMNPVNIHASCIVCARAGAAFGAPEDVGVLILGESGTGKSDLALRLIAMGANLVADDRCEVSFDGAALRARAPRAIAGLIEIRGLGIVALPFATDVRIALVARTMRGLPDRLPARRRFVPPDALGVPENQRPPEIDIDAFAVSAPAKILAAAAAFAKGLFREDIVV